nr:MAG TPA: hypothetical protein [Caudoviricetes sp.]
MLDKKGTRTKGRGFPGFPCKLYRRQCIIRHCIYRNIQRIRRFRAARQNQDAQAGGD